MKQSLFSVVLIAALLSPSSATQWGASDLAPSGQLAAQAAQSRYIITDLGTLGGNTSEAFGINDKGQVVGWSSVSGGNSHAFLWEDGMMTDLGTLGGQVSRANDINDAGQIVGMALTGSGLGHPFLWQNSVMQDLGTFGGDGGEAFGINSAGQVVGWAATSTGEQHAFLWQNGSMQDLGTLGGEYSVALEINDAGQVVGWSSRVPREAGYAFLWQGGSMQDLGTLGGFNSQAYAINNAVQVVGESFINNDIEHPFLWQNGGMQDLGTLGGDIFNTAWDINDQVQVVGNSYILTPAGQFRAFLWENGQMQDLNTLISPGSGWELAKAHAINNKGRIVGSGVINSQTRAYLLTLMATFSSTGAYDGWILESTENSDVGGTMKIASKTFNLGDGKKDKQYRAILHFDTSSLPDTAVITEATLKIERQGLVGTDPFTTLGEIAVDIRAGAFENDNALQLTDFQSAADKNDAGLIYNAPVSNWYSVVFPSASLFYINLMGVTQFRLRFQTDDNNDSVADYIKFFSGNYATVSERPTLIIEYYVP